MSTKKIFYFFSISDFSYTDGGTVRMKGIIEALIDKGYSVTLISNAKFRDEFPRNVKHIFINRKLTKNERRKIQLMTAILPFMFVKILLKNLLNHFDQIISGNLLFDKKIIFFEYFDCALAYLFKKRGIINAYVNDIHGIAPLEFWCKKPATMLGVFVKYPKYFVSELLDYKIYKLGDGIIVINQIVKDYFVNKYSFLNDKMIYIVADGISKSLFEQEIDNDLIESFKKKYHVDDSVKIVLFVGSFKKLGGVPDLVKAFIKIHNKYSNWKLLLIGGGEDYGYVEKLIKIEGIENKVILFGRTNYNKLRSYQMLSDVIVCPDNRYLYSDMIVHTKYFESLSSGKVVINGNFTAVRKINHNEQLSLSFVPSDISNLASKLIYAFDNLEALTNKYKKNEDLVKKLYGYDSFVDGLCL